VANIRVQLEQQSNLRGDDAMTKVMTPSAKPVTREQAGKFCDTLVHRLEKSGIKSEPFQKLLGNKTRADKLGDEIVALVRKHTDMIGDTVRVDRSVALVYPDWVDKPMHPELEGHGPDEYDLVGVQQWLLEKQKTDVVTGNAIYEHLKSNSMLENCLGLRDLQAIQKLGIEVFRKHFAGKAVFGWKSVVRDRDGCLLAPYLFELGGTVGLYWRWLDLGWIADYPALRLAS